MCSVVSVLNEWCLLNWLNSILSLSYQEFSFFKSWLGEFCYMILVLPRTIFLLCCIHVEITVKYRCWSILLLILPLISLLVSCCRFIGNLLAVCCCFVCWFLFCTQPGFQLEKIWAHFWVSLCKFGINSTLLIFSVFSFCCLDWENLFVSPQISPFLLSVIAILKFIHWIFILQYWNFHYYGFILMSFS